MPEPPAAGVTGIHHLTALASDAQQTIDFYTRLLGLRLVDLSVAEDDPGAYRVSFGDEDFGPGILTLVERPGVAPGRYGIGGTHHLAFETTDGDTLRQWKRWLSDHGLPVTGPYERVYFESIYFTDPDGLILEIATRGPGWTLDEAPEALGSEVKLPPRDTTIGGRDEAAIAADIWPAPIPTPTPEMRLRRMHHITAIGSDARQIERFYTELLGMRLVKRTVNFDNPTSPHLYFGVDDGAPGTIITYFAHPHGTMRPVRHGLGMTDHFALRLSGSEALVAWRDALIERGVPASGIRDHGNWQSIALHDPDGHRIELVAESASAAGIEPGVSVGRALRLPPRLEPRRPEIVQNLKPLRIPSPVGQESEGAR